MKSKIFNFISKSNQVLFFLAAIAILTAMLFSLIPRTYSQPKVQIKKASKENNMSSLLAKIQYVKIFNKRIKDVYIVELRTNKIVQPEPLHYATVRFSRAYDHNNESVLVNLIFSKENKKSSRLLKYDAYIKSFSTVGDKVKINHHYNSKNYKLDKNIYSIIAKDTNGDSTLSTEDKESFYISDYDGKQLELIMEDTEGYELVGDNLILIIKNENNKKEFYLFNAITKKLKMLDTKI